MTQKRETATIAAGCFWCVEAVFSRLGGVEKVVSGYTGGSVPNPTYREVCDGTTGHAEAVRITFDPDTISYAELLDVFWRIHDPTTLNRQGADAGTQYRSAIFYHSAEQKQVAEQVIAAMTAAQVWPKPIVTQVAPIDHFYVAEDYHQEYFARNGGQPYCQVVIAPKVSKFRKQYLDRLKRVA
jgi:peptide-methionine (S)-S-oxide reductase